MNSSAVNAQRGLAQDSRALDALHTQAAKDPKQALQAAAKQFEAVFMNMVMKSMRDTVPQGGMFDNSETKMYQGMLDQQMAQGFSEGKGTGLADMIVKQLSRNLQTQQTNTSRTDAIKEATRALQTPAAAAPTASADSPQAFVERMWSDAKTAEARNGVPAEFMVGQAALESGWGKREIVAADGTRSHNLFGIKATGGWTGKTVDAVTTEYVNGQATKKVERFRAYDSYADAFADYAKLIGDKPRYAPALQQTSAAGFASGLQAGGYATDPRYAEKLTRVINQTIALTRTA